LRVSEAKEEIILEKAVCVFMAKGALAMSEVLESLEVG
jgi:hypothetical protein